MRITQSFIKDMREYVAGNECGNIIKHKWVDGNLIDTESESMEVGCYFEYQLSKNIPKNGIIPIAKYKSSVIAARRKTQKWSNATDEEIIADLKVSDMYEDYERAHNYAIHVKNELVLMELNIINVGKKFTKGRFEGDLDLICEAGRTLRFDDGFVLKKGQRIIIDVKYSGLLDDKYSKHGWMMSPIQRKYHGTQAIQYHYVGELPFFFLVCSSTKEYRLKFFRVVIDEEDINEHITEANSLMEKFEFYKGIGFIAMPEFNKCSKCPLNNECNDKHLFPHAVPVYLNSNQEFYG